MPTLPGGIEIPSLHSATVVGVEDKRYRIRIGSITTTFPLDFANTQLSVNQQIVVVNTELGIRLFDPTYGGNDNPYPIIGEVLSHIQAKHGLMGLVIFDPKYDSGQIIALARTYAELEDLEVLVTTLGIHYPVLSEGPYRTKKVIGSAYFLVDPLSKVVTEPKLIGHSGKEAVVLPLEGLAEPVGNSSRLKPRMLEYCVEHTRF